MLAFLRVLEQSLCSTITMVEMRFCWARTRETLARISMVTGCEVTMLIIWWTTGTPQSRIHLRSSLVSWSWPQSIVQVLEATEAYRKVLSEAADHSVVISAIGFATNLAALLQTGADQYSELSGWDLVALKVRTVVWQGGWYPPLHGFGHHTYNWDCGAGNDLTIGW